LGFCGEIDPVPAPTCNGSTAIDVASFDWTAAPNSRWEGFLNERLGVFPSQRAALSRLQRDQVQIAQHGWAPLAVSGLGVPSFGEVTRPYELNPRSTNDTLGASLGVEFTTGRFVVTIDLDRSVATPLPGEDPTPPVGFLRTVARSAIDKLHD